MMEPLLKQPETIQPRILNTVLIVDDEPDIQIALEDLLVHEGYTVTVAGTGQSALALSADQQFHAVILDLGLPDCDGFDVLTKMLARTPNLPIIILTAYSSLERYIGHQGHSPAFAFLAKPFDRHELKNTLQRAIQIHYDSGTEKSLA